MLVLRSSPASPFGRKVKLSASILGLSDRIQIVDADTLNPEDSIRQQNPLGKIPALLLENGDVLYDSRVIVDYLDHLAGGAGIIPNGPERFTALRDQALADGIMDAALLQVYEGSITRRPVSRKQASLSISARSLSPVRWAISICASGAAGARAIPSSSPGWRISNPASRPMPRPE
jgi:glutathione S-transferase